MSDTPQSVHKNPLQFLLRAAQIYADKLALAHPDVEHPVRYTYAVWYAAFLLPPFLHIDSNNLRAQRVQNLAYALKQAGIKPGDRVAVLAPNSYVSFLGPCVPHLTTSIPVH